MSSTISTSSSLFISDYIRQSQSQIDQSLSRLASGLRVQSPKDDMGAYFMASNFERRSSATALLAQNLEGTIAALKSVQEPLQEIKTLLEQIADITLAGSTEDDANSRRVLALEAEQLMANIDSIVSNSTFNGVNYLSAPQSLSIQMDEGSSNTMTVSTHSSARNSTIGLNLTGNYADPVGFWGSLGAAATEKLRAAQSYDAIMGLRPDNSQDSGLARIDRNIARVDNAVLMLESRKNSLEVKSNNYEAARSSLIAVDDAKESTLLTATQIRQQAAAFFLSQSNSHAGSMMSYFLK